MKVLRVDFAKPSAVGRRLADLVCLALLCFAGLQSYVACQALEALILERTTTANLQQQLDSAISKAGAHSEPVSELPYTKDAREILAIASFDTGGVLRSIESAQIVGAKVIRIDINATTRLVALDLNVSSSDVATAYIDAINAGDDHPHWRLVRLQAQAGLISAEIRGEF